MSRSIQDLATAAMRRLGLLEAQENVSAEDFALISDVYTSKLEEWTFREMAWWRANEIPDMAFHYVADMIADIIATDFGRPAPVVNDEGGDQVSIGERGRRGIKRLAMQERSGLPTQALYF